MFPDATRIGVAVVILPACSDTVDGEPAPTADEATLTITVGTEPYYGYLEIGVSRRAGLGFEGYAAEKPVDEAISLDLSRYVWGEVVIGAAVVRSWKGGVLIQDRTAAGSESPHRAALSRSPQEENLLAIGEVEIGISGDRHVTGTIVGSGELGPGEVIELRLDGSATVVCAREASSFELPVVPAGVVRFPCSRHEGGGGCGTSGDGGVGLACPR